MARTFRVGTRGSILARRQTEDVIEALRKIHENLQFEIRVVTTAGDDTKFSPIESIPGKGRFTRTLEERLAEGCIDLAVHSAKDLPSELLEGLTIGAVPAREDPRDALISVGGKTIDALPEGSRIGTGSPRRIAQLRRIRQDLVTVPLRGNLDTRLKRLENREMEGIIVAAAGLIRMGWESVISEILDPKRMTPAAGQGALIVEARENDQEVLEALQQIDHSDSRLTVDAERAVLFHLHAGCGLPLGVFAVAEDSTLVLSGTLLSADGASASTVQLSGRKSDAARLGRRGAKRLLRRGGKEIVRAWEAEDKLCQT